MQALHVPLVVARRFALVVGAALFGLAGLERRWHVITRFWAVLGVAAAIAIVGWHGRLACGVAALTGLYLQTVPQLYGKVNYTADHL